MKKGKEWLIKELIGNEVDDYDNYYNGGYEDGLAYALKLAHQLDETEKMVVPQFVADWWERDDDSVQLYRGLQVKKKHKFDLVSSFHNLGLDDYLSRVEDWVDENDSTFLDLVNGKPYEVEKEKLYYVIDKSRKPILTIHEGKVIASVGVSKVERAEKLSTPNFKYRLTEKQIKDYDERFMAFAVEVVE